MGKTSRRPGFRFHPTDVELVMYYLKRKVMRGNFLCEDIAEVNIYKFAPEHLPEKSGSRSGDLKWYFFCPQGKKYANGARMNRATEFGYWKTTGKDRHVHYKNEVVGMIKTLIFHKGKAPRGDRTDWVMHEYRIQEKELAQRGVVQDAYVLCIVFKKGGLGPQNGAQYGAPFREEDWSDDEDVDGMQAISSALLPPPVCNPVATSSRVPESQCNETSESCLSDTIPSTYTELPPSPINNDLSQDVAQALGEGDILKMFDIFTENSTLVLNENVQKEKLGMHDGNVEDPPRLDGSDIYNDLGDLGNLTGLSGGAYNFFAGDNADYNLNGGSLFDNNAFLELCDLDAPLNSPAEARESESIHTDEQYADQNCYIPEQLSNQENSGLGNAKHYSGAPLNHGAATVFKQLPVGSSRASENPSGGGSDYPW